MLFALQAVMLQCLGTNSHMQLLHHASSDYTYVTLFCSWMAGLVVHWLLPSMQGCVQVQIRCVCVCVWLQQCCPTVLHAFISVWLTSVVHHGLVVVVLTASLSLSYSVIGTLSEVLTMLLLSCFLCLCYLVLCVYAIFYSVLAIWWFCFLIFRTAMP